MNCHQPMDWIDSEAQTGCSFTGIIAVVGVVIVVVNHKCHILNNEHDVIRGYYRELI